MQSDIEIVGDVPHNPVADLVAQGLRVVKIENDTQQLIATQRPRNEAKIYLGAVAELALAPGFAKTAYYSIPYEDRRNEKTVLIEGPSIKAAMALARRWGNCANGARIVDETDDRITVEGVFMDYETNVRTLRTVSVAKTGYNSKTKSIYKLREDRLNISIQSGMSKAVRNAILASLPASLVESYMAEAKRLAIGGDMTAGKKVEPVAVRIKKAISAFSKMGAAEGPVQAYINGLSTESEEETLAHLQGLYNAIKDGEKTIQEVFDVKDPVAPVSGDGIKKEDLLGGSK